jgi:hypothetical protein
MRSISLRNGIVAAVLGGLLSPAPVWAGQGQARACDPAGTWYGRNSLGVRFMMTTTPLDSDQQRFGVTLSVTEEADPTLGGAFPTAVSISGGHGTLLRTNAGTFQFSVIGAGLDADHRIVYFVESSGRQVSRDCGNYDISGTFAVFLPAQDGDGNGFADLDQLPVLALPYTCAIHRQRVRLPF